MDHILQQLKEFQRAVIADDEIFELGAQAMKKAFDALKKAGFTDEQAIQIVAAQGMGVKTS